MLLGALMLCGCDDRAAEDPEEPDLLEWRQLPDGSLLGEDRDLTDETRRLFAGVGLKQPVIRCWPKDGGFRCIRAWEHLGKDGSGSLQRFDVERLPALDDDTIALGGFDCDYRRRGKQLIVTESARRFALRKRDQGPAPIKAEYPLDAGANAPLDRREVERRIEAGDALWFDCPAGVRFVARSGIEGFTDPKVSLDVLQPAPDGAQQPR